MRPPVESIIGRRPFLTLPSPFYFYFLPFYLFTLLPFYPQLHFEIRISFIFDSNLNFRKAALSHSPITFLFLPFYPQLHFEIRISFIFDSNLNFGRRVFLTLPSSFYFNFLPFYLFCILKFNYI